MKTVLEWAAQLATGATTSAALVNAALARIDDPPGEGARAFVKIYRDSANHAQAADRARAAGMAPSPLAGLPVSLKDLFDVAGEPTPGGSVVLADARPAARDAAVVQRLRAAGAIFVGRTNMTEFAFAAVGLNPHYGTPRNPYDRATARIPGGSSSGAAVSVTDGMAVIGLGSDTGGSIRIPAALCGLAGFKPTQRRVPRDGVMPLSSTLDSIGALAPSATCCALTDAVLSAQAPVAPAPVALRGLHLRVLRNYVTDGLEPAVARAFQRALTALSAAGCELTDVTFPELEQLPALASKGNIAAAEAYVWHRELIAAHSERYDPRIRDRVLRGAAMSAADYIDLLQFRAALIARSREVWNGCDAVIMPTVPIVAPPIADADRDDATWGKINLALLRNPIVVNLIDGCALTVPCHATGEAPVGLTIAGVCGADARILQVGVAIEAVVKPRIAP